MGNKSLATPIDGLSAYGLMIIVVYSCCLDASIPNSLNRGRPTDHKSVHVPPFRAKFSTASQERNFQVKIDDRCVRKVLVDCRGCLQEGGGGCIA